MWAHLQLQEVTKPQLPNFDNIYDKWINQTCEEFDFFKKLHILDPASLHDIRGRRGTLIRLAAAYRRIHNTPVNDTVLTKTFDIARQLFADFDAAHGYKLLDYEKDKSSRFFGLSRSRKISTFREGIFDLLRSHDFITIDQMREEAEKSNLTQKQFLHLFNEMTSDGSIFDSGGGRYKTIDKRR